MNSGISELREKWTIAQVSTEGAHILWDFFASRQNNAPAAAPQSDRPLAIVQENGMVDAHSRVLDVGCGSGRYARWFAGNCASVTGIDLSERALSSARSAAEAAGLNNLELVCDDWHSLKLETYGWEQAFDLVFCNTSPAVQSAETFEKMLRASRNWCFMSKPTHRTEVVTHYLCKELGIDHRHRPFEWDMMYAYNWLYMEGYEPRVDYIHEDWQRQWTLEQATEYYTAWLMTNYGLKARQKEDVCRALSGIAEHGQIFEKEHTVISILYWQIKSTL